MNFTITPINEALFDGLRLALDVVAREKQFLLFTQSPPEEQMRAFYRNMVENNLIQFTALVDQQVVGWCDILPTHGEARAHVGILGIGLMPQARHQGIGKALLDRAINEAWARGLSRIELTVRTDNENARKLYERAGFNMEGTHIRSLLIDGEYHDMHAMALLRKSF